VFSPLELYKHNDFGVKKRQFLHTKIVFYPKIKE